MNRNELIVTVEECQFVVKCSNDMESMRANSFLSKEPETVRWIKNEIKPDSVFWDVGANIGLFSIYASLLQPKCKVLAFEPAAHNYASLCENIMINNLSNVVPYSIALGSEHILFSELHLSKMEAGSAIHNVGEKSPWSTSDPVFRQPCVCAPIDGLIFDYGFPQPTILKIDVDGLELDILKTAGAVLCKVTTLLVELDANDQNELGSAEEILTGHGFALSETSDRQKTINKKLPRNYIWRK